MVPIPIMKNHASMHKRKKIHGRNSLLFALALPARVYSWASSRPTSSTPSSDPLLDESSLLNFVKFKKPLEDPYQNITFSKNQIAGSLTTKWQNIPTTKPSVDPYMIWSKLYIPPTYPAKGMADAQYKARIKEINHEQQPK